MDININELKEVLTPLAEKIGSTAEYTWELLVRYQFAEGILSLLFGISSITVAYYCIKNYDNLSYRTDDVIIGALIVFLVFFGLITVYEGALHLLVPELKAIEYLFRSL